MTDRNLFGIVGLGRFGVAVAEELLAAGKKIIAVDIDESKLAPLREIATNLYKVSDNSKKTLTETGIADCSVVIVCIGDDVEANILATMNVLELGVPRVISKAFSPDHGRVLRKIGAEVIFPEVDMGKRLGASLTLKGLKSITPLSDTFSIVEAPVGPRLAGKSVVELRIRERHNINIVAIVRNSKVVEDFNPRTVLMEGDILVYAGANGRIRRFQDFNV